MSSVIALPAHDVPFMRERTAAVSFDSAALAADQKKSKSSKRRKSSSSCSEKRAYSSDLMRHLTQEDVELFNTPLSSLRSCSEFNRANSFRQFQQQSQKQCGDNAVPEVAAPSSSSGRSSFWSSISKLYKGTASTTSNSTSNNHNPFLSRKTNMANVEDEERAFLVERLRFNESNLTDGERDEMRSERAQSRLSSVRPSSSSFFLSRRKSSCTTEHNSYLREDLSNSAISTDYSQQTFSMPRSAFKPQTSFLHQSSVAVDYIFGYPLHPRNKTPMEIELKDLKKQTHSVSFSATNISDSLNQHVERNSSNPTTRESLTSLSYHSMETIQSDGTNFSFLADDNAQSIPRLPIYSMHDELGETVNEETLALTIDNPNYIIPAVDGASLLLDMEVDADPLSPTVHVNICDWITKLNNDWDSAMEVLRKQFPRSRGDDQLYETIRLQPFSAGAYLRGMLLAGLSSTCFHWYNLLTWPVGATTLLVSPMDRYLGSFLYVFLVVQAILSTLQFPCRLNIHFKCWESSQEVQIESAVLVLRTMLHSNSWMLNRLLGRVLDSLALFMLIFTEFFLYLSPANAEREVLRGIILSLGATNLLTVVCRVVVATCFSLSMHDPHVLSEARKQGLSQYDLDMLPTLTVAQDENKSVDSQSPSLANNDQDVCCAICLCDFEVGQVLTCLPCDKKHSFHSLCIRQWLQRSNSCPLCQRMV